MTLLKYFFYQKKDK